MLIKNVQQHMANNPRANSHFSFHTSHSVNQPNSANVDPKPNSLNQGNTIEGEFERKE
jgi:hypothetical protein